jgi:ADP-ribose pyrophosphatase YjhB (NUDIX family)
MNKHFTASGVVLNDKNQVLLVKHKKLGKWIYPGGHLELDETPDECVVREIFEETTLKTEIIDTRNQSLGDDDIGVTVLHNPYAILCERIDKGDKDIHFHIDLIYICKIIGGQDICHDEKESDDIGFFSLSEIKNMEMFSNNKNLIISYLENVNN